MRKTKALTFISFERENRIEDGEGWIYTKCYAGDWIDRVSLVRPRKLLHERTYHQKFIQHHSIRLFFFVKQQAFHHVRLFSTDKLFPPAFLCIFHPEKKMKIENQRSEQRHYIKSLLSWVCKKRFLSTLYFFPVDDAKKK